MHALQRVIPASRRTLATAAQASGSKFRETLASGPTLDDFITEDGATQTAGGMEHVLLGKSKSPRLPSYLKTSVPTSASYNKIKKDLRGLNLNTVCEEARCPNIGQCWGGGKEQATATIMVRLVCSSSSLE